MLNEDLCPADEWGMQNAPSHVNYEAIEEQRFQEMQNSITQRLTSSKDLGQGDSLRHVILTYVVQANYESARNELDRFVGEKSEYPLFQARAERMRRYCLDLINAIETKRNFHGLAGLPLAKQQELYENVIVHFDELKSHLKGIERQEKEARLDDVRSTAWVLKALTSSVFFVVGTMLVLDLQQGLGESAAVVFESFVGKVADAFFNFIGW